MPYPPEGLPIPPSYEQASDRHPVNADCSGYEQIFQYPQSPVIDNTAEGTLSSPAHRHHQEYAEAIRTSDIIGQYHAAVGSHYEQWEDTGDRIARHAYWRYREKLPLENECIQFEVMHPRLPVVRYLWEATLPNPDWELDRDNPDYENQYHHWQLHGYFIIADTPHPEHPDAQKVYSARQLGEVSVLRTTNVCERTIQYWYYYDKCQQPATGAKQRGCHWWLAGPAHTGRASVCSLPTRVSDRGLRISYEPQGEATAVEDGCGGRAG